MIKLVALDIDGTLLNPGVPHDAMPGPEMVAAVADLHRAGIAVVLASGRMFPGTVSVAEHLGVDEPLICQQGASTHEHDGSLKRGWAIDQQIARELVEYADSNGWSVAWFDPVRYLVTAPSPEAQFFADVSGVRIEINPKPQDSDVHATGIDIISSRKLAASVHAELERRYGDRLALLDFPSVTAVHAPQASKGAALAALAADLGVDQQSVLAVGDSVNDVSMLTWAGRSAAPGHCDDYAREAADEVLAGEGVTGVVELLRTLV